MLHIYIYIYIYDISHLRVNDLGQYSSRSVALNIYIRFTSPSSGSSFSILAVIRSRPGAFFGLTFLFYLLFHLK